MQPDTRSPTWFMASASTRARAAYWPPSSCALLLQALLAGTTAFTLDPDRPAEREVAPVGGWAASRCIWPDTLRPAKDLQSAACHR